MHRRAADLNSWYRGFESEVLIILNFVLDGGISPASRCDRFILRESSAGTHSVGGFSENNRRYPVREPELHLLKFCRVCSPYLCYYGDQIKEYEMDGTCGTHGEIKMHTTF
jgi:hypothetical protein